MVSDARELAGNIVDDFEDFLDSNMITVPNKERDDAIAEAETDEDKEAIALLYGDMYYNLEDSVTRLVKADYDEIEAKLVALCEDNEVMAKAIKDFFAKRKKEDVEGYD